MSEPADSGSPAPPSPAEPVPSRADAARTGLLVFFALAERPRRVESATLLYVLLLWWIVPGLLDVMGFPAAAQAFRPTSLSPGAGVLVMIVHLAIVAGGVAWRWRKRRLALTRAV